MSNVEFSSEGFERVGMQSRYSFITAWIFKLGLAKSEKAANANLVVFAVVILALSFYFFTSASVKKKGNEAQKRTAVPEYVNLPQPYL